MDVKSASHFLVDHTKLKWWKKSYRISRLLKCHLVFKVQEKNIFSSITFMFPDQHLWLVKEMSLSVVPTVLIGWNAMSPIGLSYRYCVENSITGITLTNIILPQAAYKGHTRLYATEKCKLMLSTQGHHIMFYLSMKASGNVLYVLKHRATQKRRV